LLDITQEKIDLENNSIKVERNEENELK